MAYLEGDGAEQDVRRAIYWLRRADIPPALTQLSCLLRNVPALADGSKDLYRISPAGKSKQIDRKQIPKNAELDYRLGVGYLHGDCRASRNKLSTMYFEHAARKGHPKAQYLLGVAFSTGRGVMLDIDRAAYWFASAAREGHRAARREYCALWRKREIQLPERAIQQAWCGDPFPRRGYDRIGRARIKRT